MAAQAQPGPPTMGGATAFFIAVGGVALILFWLMGRADRVRARRRAYADGSSDTTSSMSSANDGFSLRDWFGGSSSSPDNSCTTSDSSSSGSCGDSGGGDGGGGSGGSD